MPPRKFDEQLSFATTSEIVKRIDKWKNEKFGKDLPRAAAIRQIIERGLVVVEDEWKFDKKALENR